MTLVNISNKIINLGSDPILPDEKRNITKATAELPSIKALVDMNLLKIDDDSNEKVSADKAEASAPDAGNNGTATDSGANEPAGSNSESATSADADKKSTLKKK